MHWLVDVAGVLDHDDTEVVVVTQQSHSQRCVAINIDCLFVGCTLLQEHGTA